MLNGNDRNYLASAGAKHAAHRLGRRAEIDREVELAQHGGQAVAHVLGDAVDQERGGAERTRAVAALPQEEAVEDARSGHVRLIAPAGPAVKAIDGGLAHGRGEAVATSATDALALRHATSGNRGAGAAIAPRARRKRGALRLALDVALHAR